MFVLYKQKNRYLLMVKSNTGERRPTPDDIPPQKLEYPASQRDLTPQPDSDLSNYSPAEKLTGKVAFITGADSGIGRAVAMLPSVNTTALLTPRCYSACGER